MTDIVPDHAILQRDKRTYAIVPRIPGGLLRPQDLAAITRVTEKYQIPIVKITSGQRIALVGIEPEQVDNVYRDLGMDPGKATELCLHYVQACPGTEVCRFGVLDSLGFGIRLEEHLAGSEQPAKLKIGVSGCPFCCAENYVRDIGLMGKKGGWTLSVGGHSGNTPRVGDIVADNLEDQRALAIIDRFIAFYKDGARKKERTARFVQRVGIDTVREQLLSSLPE